MDKYHKDNFERKKINQVAEEYTIMFIHSVKLYKEMPNGAYGYM